MIGMKKWRLFIVAEDCIMDLCKGNARSCIPGFRGGNQFVIFKVCSKVRQENGHGA